MWHSSERLLLPTEPPTSFFLWAEAVAPRDRPGLFSSPLPPAQIPMAGRCPASRPQHEGVVV